MMRHAIQTVCCVAVLTLVFSLSGQTKAGAQAWPNEPAGSTVLLDCAFNTSNCSGQASDEYRSGVIEGNISTAPISQPNVLSATLPTNQTQGGLQIDFFPPGSRSNLYLGLEWLPVAGKCADMFNGENKLMFFRNASANSLIGWYTGVGGNGNPPQLWINLQGVDHLNQHLPLGGGQYLQGNTGQSAVAACGSWHRIEVFVQRNSSPGVKDGIARWWVDGRQIGNYSNIDWGSSNFNHSQITQAWDGSWSQSHGEWQHQFDHWHISTSGTSGGTADTTPPATPTGLKFQ